MFLGFLPGQYFIPPTPLPPGIPAPPIAPPAIPPPGAPGIPGSGFLPKILGPLGGALADILFNAPPVSPGTLPPWINNPANTPVGAPTTPGTFTDPPPFWSYPVMYVVWGMGEGDYFGTFQMEGVVNAGNAVQGPITGFSNSPPFGVYDANGTFFGNSHPNWKWAYVTKIVSWRFQATPVPTIPPPQPLDPPIWEPLPPGIAPPPLAPPLDPFSPLPDFAPYNPISPNNPFSAPGGNPYSPSPLPGTPPLGNPPPYFLPTSPGSAGQPGGTSLVPQTPYNPGLLPQVLPSPIIFPGTKPPTLPDPATQPSPATPPPLVPIAPVTGQKPPIDSNPGSPGKPGSTPPIPINPPNLTPNLIPDPSITPTVVGQKPPLPQDDCCDEILAQLAIIQQKLGDPIADGLSGAAESLMLGSATNRYLIMNTLSIGLHNAAMLSTDLPQTLLPSAEFFLNQPSFHYVKGDETKIIPFFTAAKSTEGTLQAALSTPNLLLLHPKFQNENRITIVGSNLFKNLVGLIERVLSVISTIQETVARIGNALIKTGGLVDDDNNYYPEDLALLSLDFGVELIPGVGDVILKAMNAKDALNNDPLVNTAPLPDILVNTAESAAGVLISTNAKKIEIAATEAISTTPNIEIDDVWGTP